MIENSREKEAVVRISQYIVRKESGELAKNCQRGLIKTVLFNCGNIGLDISEIVTEIDEQMGLPWLL